VTTRLHPLRSADIVSNGWSAVPRHGSGSALDLLVGAITEVVSGISRTLGSDMQRAEDAFFLEGHHPPTTRDLIGIRRRLAQLHRLLGRDAGGVFTGSKRIDDLPEGLLATVEKLSQRLQSLDADIVAIQTQLRLLREELDLQAAQRTNQNLYILSIMTALMLPATLVTGISA